MALTVVRPCVVCSAPMETKRSTKQTCSERCTKAHYRATQKTATPHTKKPKEATPMSTTTPMQFVFSESEYQLLCENAKFAYERHIELPHINLSGAIVEFVIKDTVELLRKHHELASAGWTLMEDTPSLRAVQVFDGLQVHFTRLYMCKPAKDQQKDLEALYAEVKTRYEQDLEAKLEAEVERQVQMVVKQKEQEALRVAEQARLKLEQDTRNELAASRAALKAKLIEDGRLTAEGTAQ